MPDFSLMGWTATSTVLRIGARTAHLDTVLKPDVSDSLALRGTSGERVGERGDWSGRRVCFHGHLLSPALSSIPNGGEGDRTGSRCNPGSGFTLIEIMVVVGIMAIIMAIAIPSVYQQMHKDSMRQAVADISEACGQARARAVLNGVATEVHIVQATREISVSETASSPPAGGGGSRYSFEGDDLVEHRAGGGGGIFSAKLSDRIIIEFLGVNLFPDLDEVHCTFYPNGTCDEMVVLIRSDRGEIRKITTEVVTGIADVEVVK